MKKRNPKIKAIAKKVEKNQVRAIVIEVGKKRIEIKEKVEKMKVEVEVEVIEEAKVVEEKEMVEKEIKKIEMTVVIKIKITYYL